MTSRRYTSPKRLAAASETRQRILQAAEELFSARGFTATTFAAIAERAGVSVPSVHLAGTKASLMINAFARAFGGADDATQRLTDQPFIQDIMSDPDSERAIARYLDFLVAANQRVARLWRAIHVAADSDPTVRVAVDEVEARRRLDMEVAGRWLSARGYLSDDDVAAAADILAYLTTPDAYLHFVQDSNWSVERYRQWLTDAIRLLVMTPTTHPAQRPETTGGSPRKGLPACSTDT